MAPCSVGTPDALLSTLPWSPPEKWSMVKDNSVFQAPSVRFHVAGQVPGKSCVCIYFFRGVGGWGAPATCLTCLAWRGIFCTAQGRGEVFPPCVSGYKPYGTLEPLGPGSRCVDSWPPGPPAKGCPSSHQQLLWGGEGSSTKIDKT